MAASFARVDVVLTMLIMVLSLWATDLLLFGSGGPRRAVADGAPRGTRRSDARGDDDMCPLLPPLALVRGSVSPVTQRGVAALTEWPTRPGAFAPLRRDGLLLADVAESSLRQSKLLAQRLPDAHRRQAYVLLLDGDDDARHYQTSCFAHVRALRSMMPPDAQRDVVVLINSDAENVGSSAKRRLRELGAIVREVEPLTVNASNVYMVKHVNKVQIWSLTEYEKIVFVDLDMVLLHSLDSLFEYPHNTFNSNPDTPHHFNSGIMVIQPSARIYERMLRALRTYTSQWDATDQAFVASTLPSYTLLPWHVCPKKRLVYTQPELWALQKHLCVHWTGEKPWKFQKRRDLEQLGELWYRYLDRWVDDYHVPSGDYHASHFVKMLRKKE